MKVNAKLQFYTVINFNTFQTLLYFVLPFAMEM
jgi:hypothetical protein